MPVQAKREAATAVAEILGLEPPTAYGPFLVVQASNDISLDFADDRGEVAGSVRIPTWPTLNVAPETCAMPHVFPYTLGVD